MTLQNDDILAIADGFWDDIPRMRHKMALAWANAGNRVLWIERPASIEGDWFTPGRFREGLSGRLRQVEERLWIGAAPLDLPKTRVGGAFGNVMRAMHRPFYLRRIRAYLKQLNFDPALLILFQMASRWDLVSRLPRRSSVYYCNDLVGFGHATPGAIREEIRCCQAMDFVFTTSDWLRRRLAPYNPETHHIPHAVDQEWWINSQHNRPPEWDRIPKPRVVYTGVLSEQVDFSLLAHLSELCPAVQFVLVGPLNKQRLDRNSFNRTTKRPNIHVLGSRALNDLPGYIQSADILMLPYVLDANRKAAGLALKFFEYLISGNPVLATPYTDFEISDASLIYQGGDANQWASWIDALLEGRLDEDRRRSARIELAGENTYQARLALQRAILDKRQPQPRETHPKG